MSNTGRPHGWQNPVTVAAGETQRDVPATELLPSRPDLWQTRLDRQLQLIQNGLVRWTAIVVTRDGVIVDGHHAVRAAADLGINVDVIVESRNAIPIGCRIQELPIRPRS